MAGAAKTTLDQLEKIKELGRGGGGIVILYRHRRTNKLYAVKCMSLFGPAKIVKRSIEACERLYHANILNFYGHVLDSRNAFLIFEYMPGGDLMSAVIRKGILVPPALGAKWVRQLVSVLVYLHKKKGVMHRDIKPSNVLLTNVDLAKADVKLADFDTCRSILMGKGRYTQGIGTKDYMAPDVVQGGDYSEEVDIWSLGCLVFELFTLMSPFHQSLNRSVSEIQQRGPAFPANPRVPEIVQNFIMCCLVFDGTNRPSSVELLKHPFLAPDQIYSMPPGPMEVLANRVREEEKDDEEDESGFGGNLQEEIRDVKSGDLTLVTDITDLTTNLQEIIDKQMECVAIFAKLVSPCEAKAACDIAKKFLLLSQNLVNSAVEARRSYSEEASLLQDLNSKLTSRQAELTSLGEDMLAQTKLQ